MHGPTTGRNRHYRIANSQWRASVGAERTFWFATQRKDLNAAFIFYGTAPPAAALAGITVPGYGFYAEIDPRATKTLDTTKTAIVATGKTYDAVIYPGSEHMFVRFGEMSGNTNPANIEAREQVLARFQRLLKSM